ncbi:DUF4283 domain protein [Medicago truncatula]|uniref:DUF4283 domain protein n=1 Tax=Medicago truncatula TaxID=3880 RepID=G7JZA3_MEDTR|nr:DUF4283 domain protein [Medicago truncatula]
MARVSNGRLGLQHEEKVQFDGRVSNEYGSRVASAEWHNSDVVEFRDKASFYVTNFPDNMSLFRLRQAFEVCKILSDVFIARHRNARGQEFGFVRYMKVKNKDKLSQDLKWAQSGMVSLVLEGESSLAIQQKVDDAGFPNVVVTQLGGDRVFIHCNNGEDTWKVFDDAVHFFGMLFTTVRKWMPSEVKYERGAWLRIYGVPIHAWTEDFFRLCVLDTGRFLHIDDCTVDKARLDYA